MTIARLDDVPGSGLVTTHLTTSIILKWQSLVCALPHGDTKARIGDRVIMSDNNGPVSPVASGARGNVPVDALLLQRLF